ncbi:hypothetical protein C8C88_0513 [Flavobacterium sp. 123]|nr:hypothetical protein C8C88_0513 [Flavobacterium sp. 123]
MYFVLINVQIFISLFIVYLIIYFCALLESQKSNQILKGYLLTWLFV